MSDVVEEIPGNKLIKRETVDENYIKRFPTKLRNCLKKEENLKLFCEHLYDTFSETWVYRGIHSPNTITKEDFMGNVDTAEYFKLESYYKDVPKSHSVSVNTDKKMLIKSTKIPNKNTKLIGISKGIMSFKNGPATFEGDRPHHHWYLFEDCIETVAKGFFVSSLEDEE